MDLETDLQNAMFAIQHRPDDDGPRLKYAALIAATDPAYAEFIVLHCAMWARTASSDDEARLMAVWEENHERWRQPFGALADSIRFSRGFVDEVHTSVLNLVSTRGLDLQPIRQVTLEQAPHGALAGPVVQLLDRIEKLKLQDSSGAAEWLEFFLQDPTKMSRLKTLEFFDPLDCRSLTRRLSWAPDRCLTHLAFVGLEQTDFDDECAANLCRHASMSTLRSLILWNCNLRAAGAAALATGNFGDLQVLKLGLGQHTHNAVGVEGAKSLAASAPLRGLEEIDLDFNHIGDDGLLAWLDGKRALQRLRLRANDLSDASLLALAKSDWFGALRVLDLTSNPLSPRVAEAMLARSDFQLHSWSLAGTDDAAACARAIAASERSSSLRVLYLPGGLDDDAALALATSPHLPALQQIWLTTSALSPATVATLEKRWGDRLMTYNLSAAGIPWVKA